MLATVRSAAISLVLLLGWGLTAQADEHPYSLGTVWEISYIQTKPGKFEDYMKFLSTIYVKEMEAAKAKGLVTSYKVLTVIAPGDNAPDLILMVEHPKFAVLDTPMSVQDEMDKAVFGSLPKSAQAASDRESIRTLRGGLLTQEIKLGASN
jgi:hypothetical protein